MKKYTELMNLVLAGGVFDMHEFLLSSVALALFVPLSWYWWICGVWVIFSPPSCLSYCPSVQIKDPCLKWGFFRVPNSTCTLRTVYAYSRELSKIFLPCARSVARPWRQTYFDTRSFSKYLKRQVMHNPKHQFNSSSGGAIHRWLDCFLVSETLLTFLHYLGPVIPLVL